LWWGKREKREGGDKTRPHFLPFDGINFLMSVNF